MNKPIVIAAAALVTAAVAGVAAWALLWPESEEPAEKTSASAEQSIVEPSEMTEPAPAAATDETTNEAVAGRYVDYSAEQASDDGYTNTILFFHAPWCPDCRAYDEAIKSAQVPDSTQILKVDYDSNKELRQQYGVTVQTTFVRVDANGNQETTWVGYGKDASLEAVLENTV